MKKHLRNYWVLWAILAFIIASPFVASKAYEAKAAANDIKLAEQAAATTKAEALKALSDMQYLQGLYAFIPDHLKAAGWYSKAILGMRPTGTGGQIKVLVGSQEDDSLYVLVYSGNSVSYWVESVQVIRGGSPFNRFSSHNEQPDEELY